MLETAVSHLKQQYLTAAALATASDQKLETYIQPILNHAL